MLETNKKFEKKLDKVILKSSFEEGILLNNELTVTMKIEIDQLHDWLSKHFKEGLIKIRSLWKLYCNYTIEIINYGYFFANKENIDKFVSIDKELEKYAKKNKINICSPGCIKNGRISADENFLLFDLSAEAFLADDDPDYMIPIPEAKEAKNAANENPNETQEERERRQVEELPDSDEEEMRRLLADFENDNELHARIADRVLIDEMNSLSNVDYFKRMNILPKPTSHEMKQGLVSVKLAVTKRQFVSLFEMYRNEDSEKAWEEFRNDIVKNPSTYTTWNMDDLSEYLINNNISIERFIPIVKDVDISNKRVVRFWMDAVLE